MKNALLLLLGLALLTASCRKKSTPVHCYVLTLNDSTYSNIPALSVRNVTSVVFDSTLCGKTNDMMNVYIREYNYRDTVLYTDTIEVKIATATYSIY